MQVGIASSMWRGLADLPFPEYVTHCRDAGAEVIELSGWPDSYGRTLTLDEAGIAQARALTGQAGMTIVAVGCPDDLVQPDETALAEQVALIRRTIDVAASVGAHVVALKVGTPKEGVDTEAAVNLIISGLKQVADYAEERRVFLALENRSTLTNDVDLLLRVINETRNKYVRALLDTGNFLQRGYSPDEVLEAVERVAPYTVHTHLKDGRGHGTEFRPAPLGRGELDIPRILRVLKVCGYLRPICAQYEGPDQPAVYPEEVRYIREHTRDWEIASGAGVVRGLHHVSISLKDFETAYAFYGELLGLPLTPAQGISYSPVLLFQLPTGEEFHVHLGGPSTHAHVALEVEDFPGVVARLRAANVPIRMGPDKRGDGSDFLFCIDPAGNSVELTHHYTWRPARLLERG